MHVNLPCTVFAIVIAAFCAHAIADDRDECGPTTKSAYGLFEQTPLPSQQPGAHQAPPRSSGRARPALACGRDGPQGTREELAQVYTGMRFWYEAPGRADKSAFRFRTGDVVSLKFETNRTGYVYIVNVDTHGVPTLLYPDRHSSETARIRKFAPVSFPAEFNGAPGVEDVFLVFSESELADPLPFVRAAASALLRPAGPSEFGHWVADMSARPSRSKSMSRDISDSNAALYYLSENADPAVAQVQVLRGAFIHESR